MLEKSQNNKEERHLFQDMTEGVTGHNLLAQLQINTGVNKGLREKSKIVPVSQRPKLMVRPSTTTLALQQISWFSNKRCRHKPIVIENSWHVLRGEYFWGVTDQKTGFANRSAQIINIISRKEPSISYFTYPSPTTTSLMLCICGLVKLKIKGVLIGIKRVLHIRTVCTRNRVVHKKN